MTQVDNNKQDYDGREVHCYEYMFLNYDKAINPLYTGDEIRALDFDCGSFFRDFYGIINNSMNNFKTTNGYSKIFEYRTDGRPMSCLVQQNGKNVFKLIYEYK